MNLENLDLQEMSIQEMNETEGGFLPLIIIGVALLVSSCVPCRDRP